VRGRVNRRPEEDSPARKSSEQGTLLKSVIERVPVEVRQELEALHKAGAPSVELFRRLMASLGPAIAQAFSVREDEVAILLVRDQGHMLGFAYPWGYYADKKNLFPVSAPSIAGEVVRTSKGRIDNNASQVQHLDIYERIGAKAKGAVKIQKMISAPLLSRDGQPLGAIQVSRKAKSLPEAGPHFTPADLANLAGLCTRLAPLIQKAIPLDY